ncbi:T9SS type A sorting domain-containing protein, partial [bacterium]|nr:T9SS type A sorting domain-containing protein [bacterium]
TPVNVYKGATLLGSPIMNGGGMGMGCGFFMLNYVAGVPGSDWWCEIVVSPDCKYTSRMFTTVDGPQSIAIVQGDWTCDCEPPPACIWLDPWPSNICLTFEYGQVLNLCWCCTTDDIWIWRWVSGCAECDDPNCTPYVGPCPILGEKTWVDSVGTCPGYEPYVDGYWTRTITLPEGEGCICFYWDEQLPVQLVADPILQIGDRQLTLKFNVSDELNVQHYNIIRDGDKVAELDVGDGAYTYVDQNLINGRRYEYSIVAVGIDETTELDRDGNTVWAATPSLMAAVVTEYALHQNYPNPFNPSTEIVYDVLDLTHVTLKVYNVMGQEVATLVNRETTTGRYAVTFDASGLTSGLYFYTVTMGDFTATKKMLLVR